MQTWIEDLTKPLAERKAEPLPPLEVPRALLPRSWSPDGSTLAGDLEFYVTPNSVTLLYSFASTRTYRALPEGHGSPEWLSDTPRLLVAEHDRIVLVDTRTGRASPVLSVAAQGPGPADPISTRTAFWYWRFRSGDPQYPGYFVQWMICARKASTTAPPFPRWPRTRSDNVRAVRAAAYAC